jgi:hypothetical protein
MHSVFTIMCIKVTNFIPYRNIIREYVHYVFVYKATPEIVNYIFTELLAPYRSVFTSVSQGTIYISYSLLPHGVEDKKVQLCTIVCIVL